MIEMRLEDLKHGLPFKAPPTLVVLHYTAGPTYTSAIGGFKGAGTSSHFVLDVDGTTYQTLPDDVVAYHAGESSRKGRTSCNSFARGIEICNWGLLTKTPAGTFETWAKKPVPENFVFAAQDGTFWHTYPDVQLEGLYALCSHLFAKTPSLTDIAGHSVIAPKRKVDPGPALKKPSLCKQLQALVGTRGGILDIDPRT
jgi:N-acetylmuramoyl-L-alanine amidase